MNERELTELIGRARRRDPEAFDTLIDAFGPRLHGFLYRLSGSRHDADDLLQELFLRVVRMIHTYRHDGRFEGWLFRIAANLARDLIRKKQRAPQAVSLEAPGGSTNQTTDMAWSAAADLSGPSPDGHMIFREDVDAMQRALAQLPAAEREVVMLRHFSDLSFNEIAEAMGTPLGTALARAHRGLAKLREQMTDQ